MSTQENETDAYYKLKSEYAEKNNVLPGLLANMPEGMRATHKCSKCRRQGGVVFQENAGELRATCGADPKCDLNMSVARTERVVMLPWLLSTLQARMEKEKTKLIELKIRHALGNVEDDAVVVEYERISDILRRLSAATASVDERLLSVTDDPARRDAINRLKAELYTAIQEFKSNLGEFQATGRDAFMVDALEHQNNVLQGVATELRKTTYEANFVEYQPDMDEYVLTQNAYTLKQLEVPFLQEFKELIA